MDEERACFGNCSSFEFETNRNKYDRPWEGSEIHFILHWDAFFLFKFFKSTIFPFMTFSMSISLECTRSVDSRWRTPSESISQIKWRNPFFTRGHSRMRYYSPRANTHSRLIDRKIIKIIGINRIERRGTSNKLRHRLHWLNWTNIYLFFSISSIGCDNATCPKETNAHTCVSYDTQNR